MRAADRRRVEAQISQLAGKPVGVGWFAHYFDPGTHAIADADLSEVYIVLAKWKASNQAERADTIAHEVAHLLTPGDGHCAKWTAELVRLLPLAQALTW